MWLVVFPQDTTVVKSQNRKLRIMDTNAIELKTVEEILKET